MKIIIRNGTPVPIYEQVKIAIKENILTNQIQPGEQLPSVRTLSRELKISILTVKKAYDELEVEGFIISKQGIGTFVAEENIHLRNEEKQKKLEDNLINAISLSMDLGLSKNSLFDLFDYLYGGQEIGQ